MIEVTASGDYKRTEDYLKKLSKGDIYVNFDRYGQMGVDALANATPTDTGETANSWHYRIIRSKTRPAIEWYNTNDVDGYNVAILLQYGHATGTGGYVKGIDYVNPAIRPVFEQILAAVTAELRKG